MEAEEKTEEATTKGPMKAKPNEVSQSDYPPSNTPPLGISCYLSSFSCLPRAS